MASVAETADTTSTAPNTRPLTWSRLGSFVSLLPLGVWTVNHLWDNLAAFSGAQAWQTSVTSYAHPWSHAATLLIVLLPLLIHTVWGLQRLFSFKPNNAHYKGFNNLKYLLQRISALGVLGFLGAHIFLAMIKPRLLEGHAEPFEDIAREMRWHGPTLIVYLLGTLGVAYHFGNGIFGFAWTWGLASGRKSFQRFNWIAIISFLILLAMSWGVIFALYQAGEALGPAPTH